MSRAQDIIDIVWAAYYISEEMIGRERFVKRWRAVKPVYEYVAPVATYLVADDLNTSEQDY